MDTGTYPDARVADAVTQHFVPVRVNARENRELVGRFGARWTPTLLVLDPDERVHRRWEGYLPPADFLVELRLARAHAALDQGRYEDAAREFAALVREAPDHPEAPEAQYWLGVAEYRRTGDAERLRAAWNELAAKYPQSLWTRRVFWLN